MVCYQALLQQTSVDTSSVIFLMEKARNTRDNKVQYNSYFVSSFFFVFII